MKVIEKMEKAGHRLKVRYNAHYKKLIAPIPEELRWNICGLEYKAEQSAGTIVYNQIKDTDLKLGYESKAGWKFIDYNLGCITIEKVFEIEHKVFKSVKIIYNPMHNNFHIFMDHASDHFEMFRNVETVGFSYKNLLFDLEMIKSNLLKQQEKMAREHLDQIERYPFVDFNRRSKLVDNIVKVNEDLKLLYNLLYDFR